MAIPLAAVVLVVAGLLNNLLGAGVGWFAEHQAALGSYVAAGLFAASLSVVTFLELPAMRTPRARSPLEGLRRTKSGTAVDKGRTGVLPLLVSACAALAAVVAAAVAVAVLHAKDLGGGPVLYGLTVAALTGGVVVGIRTAPALLPTLSRRRLLALAIAFAGVALLAAGLVPDDTTVLLLLALAGTGAGVAANTGHALLDQETEDHRRARTTEHLHAVVRVCVALGAVVGPVLAAAIGPHRLENGKFVFAHGGAAFVLMLLGALLLPLAALVLAKVDDRSGVPLRHDLRDALLGGDDPVPAPAATGFFIALEGGDGAGKSTQAEALAEWIRGKGHEVVLTREPGATPVGKRLRLHPAGRLQRRTVAPRGGPAVRRRPRGARRHRGAARPGARCRGHLRPLHRLLGRLPGRGPRPVRRPQIARINRWATNGLVPHLTVLLDVAPEAARERFTEAPDRLESEPAEFHARVRSGFLTLAAADPGRYLVVDAGQEPEAVTTAVRHRLDQVLPLSEAEIEAREEARRKAEEEARRAEEEARARPRRSAGRERAEEGGCAPRRRSAGRAGGGAAAEAVRRAEEARQRAEEARGGRGGAGPAPRGGAGARQDARRRAVQERRRW
ncbi:Thymidylate kinase OS=Streptomyces tendae OX=1932 GN=tmk PE=3 SV=1 [Streptomyces tendae]